MVTERLFEQYDQFNSIYKETNNLVCFIFILCFFFLFLFYVFFLNIFLCNLILKMKRKKKEKQKTFFLYLYKFLNKQNKKKTTKKKQMSRTERKGVKSKRFSLLDFSLKKSTSRTKINVLLRVVRLG